MVDLQAPLRSAHDDRAPGLEQWALIADELLAGLVHALNNRVTALSVSVELSALGDSEAFTGGLLSAEVGRLQRLSVLLGLLPMRQHDAEALDLEPVVDDAIALHAHHSRARRARCVVTQRGTMQPVRVPRWALLRALVLLVQAATTDAEERGGEQVAVVLQGDDDAMRVRVQARGDAGPYAAEVAARCGGVVARDGDELVLTLPSLLALRRREHATRAPG